MNIVCNIQKMPGGWRVEARTPNGAPVVVYRPGSLDDAIEAAVRAETEPA